MSDLALQGQLPEPFVVPATELTPDLVEGARQGEAKRFVQGHAGFVGQGDDRDGKVSATVGQVGQQRRHQFMGDAGPMVVGVDEDGGLTGGGVTGAVAELGGVGVPGDVGISLQDQPRVGLSNALGELLLGRRVEFERDRRVADHGAIDREQRRCVCWVGTADATAGVHHDSIADV